MLLIAAIACIVGLVWGILLLTRGSLVAGCLVVLLLNCCFGPYFYSFELAGVTLTLDRIGLIALVAAFLVQWRLGRVAIRPLARVDYFLLAFIGLLVVSTFTHDWRGGGGQEPHIVQHLINGYLIPLVLYWIARHASLNERNVTLILGALACFGVYLAATGIFEATGQWSLVFPRYIGDPEIGLHYGRARGPMVHSVSYGMYLAAGLLGAWLWGEGLGRRGKLAFFLVLPAFAAALFFSKTRSVWLGAASGWLVVLWLTLRGRMRMALVGAMLVAGLAVGIAKRDAILAFNRGSSAENTRRSASMRSSFAYVSWLMFQDRPWFGFGFGQFAGAKLPYLSDRSTELQLESIRAYVQHNTFLSLLTETGLVGLGLFLAVLGGWARWGLLLVKSRRAPPWVRRHGVLLLGVLAVALWQMMFHEITYTPLDNSLNFLIAGVAVGLEAARQPAARHLAAAPIGQACPIVQ